MVNPLHRGACWALLAALAAFTQPVWALGLGNAFVESYLNQPLRVRIELIVRDSDDLSTVTAGLASAEDFALIGADREAISVPLRFAIDSDEKGAVILVTSTLPVNDPVVRIIVEVNWSSGRMLREYTLFLDPPTFTAPAPSPAIDQRKEAPAAPAAPAVEPAPAQAMSPEPESVSPTTESPGAGGDAAGTSPGDAVQAGATPAEGEYGPVQGGDTLWRIASNWSQGSGLDMSTVMIAIQRSNPQAFINNNINLLRQGAILRMPEAEDLARISSIEARAEVQQQSEGNSRELVPPAVETPLIDESSTPVAATNPVEETPAEGKLELVPPSESSDAESAYGSEEETGDAGASTSVETLREELARKEEALIVEEQQNQYLQERIAELEAQAAAAQQGNVANDNLSEMEKRLRDEREATAAAEAQPKPSQTTVPGRPQPVQRKETESWYSGRMVWVIGLLVLVLGGAGWFLARRSSGAAAISGVPQDGGATVRGIENEAREILKVLEPVKEKPAADPANIPEAARDAAVAIKPGRLDHIEEAELLDEDSADPEVRLDLARAYISMGDKEAARVILAEVVEHGNAEQQNEAKAMLGEI